MICECYAKLAEDQRNGVDFYDKAIAGSARYGLRANNREASRRWASTQFKPNGSSNHRRRKIERSWNIQSDPVAAGAYSLEQNSARGPSLVKHLNRRQPTEVPPVKQVGRTRWPLRPLLALRTWRTLFSSRACWPLRSLGSGWSLGPSRALRTRRSRRAGNGLQLPPVVEHDAIRAGVAPGKRC